MKTRSDSVPAWPFALICTGVILLTVARPLYEPKRARPVFNARGHEITVSPDPDWSHRPEFSQPLWEPGVPGEQRAKHSEWGNPTEGLQLLLRVYEGSGRIATWLRNASTNEVLLYDWDLLSSRSIFVELRQGTEWVRVTNATHNNLSADGSGPPDIALRKLDPAECLASYPMLVVYYGIPLVDPASRMGRPIPAVAPVATALHTTEWPDDLSVSNRVTIRLVQRVAVPDGATPWYNAPDPVASFESLARLRHIIFHDPKPGYRTKGWHWIWVASAPVDIDPRRVVAMTSRSRCTRTS